MCGHSLFLVDVVTPRYLRLVRVVIKYIPFTSKALFWVRSLLQFTDLRESTAIVRYAETLLTIGIAPIERQKVQMDSTEPILELVLLLYTLIDH